MEQYLIDTNIVSHYFSADIPAAGLEFMDNVIDAVPNLSIITQIELLCWKNDAAKERKIKEFISDSVILDISSEVVKHCVNIRRNKKIKTPDAIIAATAITYGYTLLTDDETAFANIKSLKIMNPHKL